MRGDAVCMRAASSRAAYWNWLRTSADCRGSRATLRPVRVFTPTCARDRQGGRTRQHISQRSRQAAQRPAWHRRCAAPIQPWSHAAAAAAAAAAPPGSRTIPNAGPQAMPCQPGPSHATQAMPCRAAQQGPHLGALALEGGGAVGGQAQGEDQHHRGAVDAAHNLGDVLRHGGQGRNETDQRHCRAGAGQPSCHAAA